MRVTALGAAVAAIVACAGCAASGSIVGGSAGPSPRPGAATPVAQPLTSSPGENRLATQREAARLLSLAPLPAGITPVAGPQPKLLGPVTGRSSTSSLIDDHRFWHVSMPESTVWAYLNAHQPAGLTASGSGTSSTRGVLTAQGLSWAEPNRTYAVGLELDVSLAPIPGGTLIRADGMGEWIDPRPIRDSQPGQRLRVTVAGGCPSADKGVVGVSNPGTGLDAALLPSANPSAALICAYGGLNPPHVFALSNHVLVPAGGAQRIAREALQLPLSHTDGGETSCPMDDESFVVIAFHYPGHPDVDLGFHSTGCTTVANGHITTSGTLNLRPYVRR